MISIYNSLTEKKEEFTTIEPNKVKMYACGITVSKPAHIGHAYQAVVFDMITKYFKYSGYDVFYVRNYTDVDDKIIDASNELHENPIDYANKLIKETDAEMKALGIENPNVFARVTENIPEIIDFISKLIEKGFGYADENGNVFFDVKKFRDYGKLSKVILENNYTAVRKKLEEGKTASYDFALWKSAKENEISWDSPWGKGRPGWHIECSCMSLKYLGETFDIHGGGRDLKFPHHENEIAQSEALTDKPFVNYWIHNGLVKINGEKMSKSLNNSILLSDLLKNYNKEVIRMTLLNNAYASDLNITDGIFENSEKQLYGFYKSLNINNSIENKNATNEVLNKLKNDFENYMNDNFNTPGAISILFEFFNTINKNVSNYDIPAIKESLKELYYPLGLFSSEPTAMINEIKNKYLNGLDESIIVGKINERNEAKINKNYELSDKIRKELESMNIQLNDTREGTTWDVYFK